MLLITLAPRFLLSCFQLPVAARAAATEKKPTYVGVGAIFGYAASTPAQVIRMGKWVAMADANQAAGEFAGWHLKRIERDNISLLALNLGNLKELAAQTHLAVIGGRFSATLPESPPRVAPDGAVVRIAACCA